jgi:ribosomal protein L7/L12
MTDPESARRIAELELKVDGLVQLVEHLYHRLGVSPPSYRPPEDYAGHPFGAQTFSGLAPDDPIRLALAAGDKIAAIKLYRERTGLGLAEAKDAVEAIARQG